KIIRQLIQKALNADGRFERAKHPQLRAGQAKVTANRCRSCDCRSCACARKLQPDRVTRFETTSWNTLCYLTARLPSLLRSDIRRGIEPQRGDDGVSVTVA